MPFSPKKHFSGVSHTAQHGSRNDIERERLLSMPMTAKNHLGKLAENLKDMREKEILCDYYLKAGSTTLPVHKVVMAASSDYFLTMLTTNMRESRESEVNLKGVTACALTVIVEFAYTGILKLNMENVEEVLAGATHLQVNDAVKLCSRYIETSITPKNCVDVLNLAELFSLETTTRIAKKFILENFENVAQSEQYQLLTLMQLAEMLQANSLKVNSEYNLFELVLRWVNHMPETREAFVPELMKYVRLPLLSGEELVDKVSRVDIMKKNKNCLDLLTEAKDYHILIGKQPLNQTARTQVRSDSKSLVMCYGLCLEGYPINDSHRLTRVLLKDPIAPLYNPCVTVIDNFLYVCGGKYDNQASNEIATARCFRYDPRFDTWYELASMIEPRRDFALVGLEGHIYAIGGQDENKMMNTVECYSVAQNEWDRKCSLHEQVYGHAAAVCEGKIYISGGQIFSVTSKKLYVYNVVDDSWEERTNMLYPRIHHVMEEVRGALYCIGGSGHGGLIFPTITPTVESYNPQTNQWTLCKPHTSIVDSGSCVVNDKIYMVGGAFIDGITIYNPASDELTLSHATILSGKACGILVHPHYV
ncbi:kelch-like protein 26 [Argopecten irradians]|uniref:kelch-like protein 26 n=1 Tax=Argopecten irradians TaxID=31199 RepID=UPI003723275A